MTHRGPFQPLPFCDSVILSDFYQGSHPLITPPLPTAQLSLQGASKEFFLPFLTPECKAWPLHMGQARLLPAPHAHRLLVLRGPLAGSAPLMFSVSYRNNQPAPVRMSVETSEQWVKSAPQENVV